MTEKLYEAMNYLFVDMKDAGAELVELTGIATGYQYSEHRVPSYLIDDMEKKLEQAMRSIHSYRVATERKTERLSRADYTAMGVEKRG